MMVKQRTKKSASDRDDLVFKAMSGSDRRKIMDLLHESPMTTSEICRQLVWLDRCTVMQHLRVLENARLVISRKKGRCRWNYLDVGRYRGFMSAGSASIRSRPRGFWPGSRPISNRFECSPARQNLHLHCDTA